MMRRIRLWLVVVVCSGVAVGAEPASPVRMPASVSPVPASTVTELSADAIFVIECDSPCLVLASRVGFVSILEEAGPLRIRGRFVDGQKVESRTYKAKQLWIVEALTAGEVELLVVPVGVKDEAGVIRRTLIVGGVAPRPKPTDPVDPKPLPPAPLPELLGFAKVVKESVRKNVPVGERVVALEIAKAYREGATNIATGAWPIDKAIANQTALNRQIPGYKVETWRLVGRDVADVLAAAKDAGRFETKTHFVAVWSELSAAYAGALE